MLLVWLLLFLLLLLLLLLLSLSLLLLLVVVVVGVVVVVVVVVVAVAVVVVVVVVVVAAVVVVMVLHQSHCLAAHAVGDYHSSSLGVDDALLHLAHESPNVFTEELKFPMHLCPYLLSLLHSEKHRETPGTAKLC